ncbi:MAG: hypothetical protein P8X74_05485 [Reinekea sp.]
MRDQKERDAQIFLQLEETKKPHNRTEKPQTLRQQRTDILTRDIDQYREIQRGERDVFMYRERR